MLTRRGFLRSLAAAAGTAAVFDPGSLLWMPKAADVSVSASELAAAIDAAGVASFEELRHIGEVAARRLSERLERERATTLGEIWYRQTGTLAPASVFMPRLPMLDVEGLGQGVFRSEARHLMPGIVGRGSATTWARTMADALYATLPRLEVFAPMSTEMRPGVPFADMDVVVVEDPESLLSLRVMRWTTTHGARPVVWTGLEVAGGHWHAKRRRQSTAVFANPYAGAAGTAPQSMDRSGEVIHGFVSVTPDPHRIAMRYKSDYIITPSHVESAEDVLATASSVDACDRFASAGAERIDQTLKVGKART